MRKIVPFLILFFLISPVLAKDFCSGADANIDADNIESIDGADSDMQDSDDFYRELIAPEYGSDQSPAFLNRENMNPNEADYGYGTADGVDYEESTSDAFNCEDSN